MNWRLELISLAFQIPTMAIALALPILRIVKKGVFWSSFLLMWLYLTLWALINTTLFPPFAVWMSGDKKAWEYFPEGPAVMAVVFTGWINCFLLCGLAWAIRMAWVQRREKLK